MNLYDVLGLIGVATVFAAYVGGQLHRLDPAEPPSLLLNFTGASLILASMIKTFNLSAALIEVVWMAAALFGLVRVLLRKR